MLEQTQVFPDTIISSQGNIFVATYRHCAETPCFFDIAASIKVWCTDHSRSERFTEDHIAFYLPKPRSFLTYMTPSLVRREDDGGQTLHSYTQKRVHSGYHAAAVYERIM